jgi:phenylalanyl-tRNA synthetase beta chain
LDPELAETAINRAMELIESLGCGKVMPGMADAYANPVYQWRRKVVYDPARINALLGTDIKPDEMIETLARIGIDTHVKVGQKISPNDGKPLYEPNVYEAEPPTFRNDLNCEADIAEEIARFHGFNNIESVNVQSVYVSAGRGEERNRLDFIAQTVRGLGYHEALTYPFESPKVFDKLLIPADDLRWRKAITISNPLGEDFSVMRTLPLNGLLQSLSVNYNRRSESARLYELAYTYFPKALPLTELPDESPVLTLAAYDAAGLDFLDIKGDVEELLSSLGIRLFTFTPCEPNKVPFMHPGRSAAVSFEKNINIGFLGELHPNVCANYEIGVRAYVAVLDMESIHKEAALRKPVFKPMPKFPSVQRDLAFKLKADINAAAAEATIRERGGPLLYDVRLFDVYQGPQLEEGYKSMAYSLRFRSPDRTLTDEDIKKPLKAILDNLQSKLGAELR